MEIFNGDVKVLAGTIKTWQQLIMTAIDARVFSADAPTNAKLRAQAKDRVRGASAYIRRFYPATNIYTIDAYKGNTNGTLSQAAWTLPGDVTASPGGGTQYDGGIEQLRNHRTSLSSEAVYAAADTTINVLVEAE